MQLSIFHKLGNILWGIAVVAIVVLALYVSLGRLLSSNLEFYQEEVLEALNVRTPLELDAQKLSGEWHSFSPIIVLSTLRLGIPGAVGDALELSEGRVALDILESLRTRSLQFSALQLEGLELRGELDEDGRIHIPGLTSNEGEVGGWLRELLLNIERVTLTENNLNLRLPSGDTRKFLLDLRFDRDGSERKLRGELVSTAGTHIRFVGEGLGDPFERDTFRGQLYVDIQAADLAEVEDMLAQQSPAIWAQGTLDAELWLAWNSGEASVDVRIDATDVLVRPKHGDWHLPFERLSLEGSLVEKPNRWTVFASSVRAQDGKVVVDLPRVQLDVWDTSLRVRASELELAPLNSLFVGFETLPDSWTGVFRDLQLQGDVSSLQMSIADISAPAQDWALEANFENVQVESWNGAPGATAASGYAEFSPGRGEVVVDSQKFTLNFPTVYRQPLYFDDIYGSVNLAWDEDSLVLHSGVLTTAAEEGRARALFRLNIPFSTTDEGLEMDLMVGLKQAEAVYRSKYIPYILASTLTDWLAESISEGRLEHTGFIWRGSLRGDAHDLRTVQLFVDVSDAVLDYHPAWPAITDVAATVLVDDTNISVWVDRAKLYEQLVQHLSAEAWMGDDAQMRLAIDASLSGSAADGLAVVNNSLLDELVGGVFRQWELDGALQTQLQLELNLQDSDVLPKIEVSTVWKDVSLQIAPGDLNIESISGDLQFSSARGFSSQALQGRLWGEPITAHIGQPALAGEPFDMRSPTVAIEFSGDVTSDAIQSWLQQDVLALASGRSTAEVLLTVTAKERVQLLVTSDLEGMALDLPQPWAKPASTIRPLRVTLPLGGHSSEIAVELEEVLQLKLSVGEGRLRAASLGVAAPAPALQAGNLEVAGYAELLDVDALTIFIETYIYADAQSDDAVVIDSAVPIENSPARAELPLRINLDSFQAKQLRVWGIDLADVEVTLGLDSTGWAMDIDTQWLHAAYSDFDELDVAKLQIDLLDLKALSGALADQPTGAPELEAGEQARLLELPPMSVDVAGLRYGDIELGQLAFLLDSEGGDFRATDIVGDIAGLAITAEEPAQLQWKQGATGSTELAGRLYFEDLGETLQRFGYEKLLETERGHFDVDLQWAGAPQAYSLLTTSGLLELSAGRGRFLETPAGATGALRVVGILNLADLVQRLNITQMFESGIPFHKVQGSTSLSEGTISVPSLAVQGASSSFEFSGVSDIATKQLEGELVATLPVASNLPWVAALAGGLPVAAGVFVVSKVFEKQMKKLSSGVYSVSGDWDDPQIDFSRIFDDSSRAVPQSPSP